MDKSFFIPKVDKFTTEQIIKKSRFIATLHKVKCKDDAMSFLSSTKEIYKDARHNCWGFLVGTPNSPTAIGYSDDGEPKGTAGKPILNVIQQKNISQVMIIVTRYFGGIKLGASGLIRAYSGTANLALEKAGLIKFEKKCQFTVKTTYLYINNVLNILTHNNIVILDSNYSENIILNIEMNEKIKDTIAEQIIEATKGSSKIIPI
jgi:uncharacterized YigZ family protein